MIRLTLAAVSLAALGWSGIVFAAAPNENATQRSEQQKPANSGEMSGTPAHPQDYPSADSARQTNCSETGGGAENSAKPMNCTPGQSGSSQPSRGSTTPGAAGGTK